MIRHLLILLTFSTWVNDFYKKNMIVSQPCWVYIDVLENKAIHFWTTTAIMTGNGISEIIINQYTMNELLIILGAKIM